MTTYTIAYLTPGSDGSTLLLALEPDGPDARAKALQVVSERFLGDHEDGTVFAEEDANIKYESGLTLTNEYPDDEDRIAWYGCGVELSYENVVFKYAVRPPAPPEQIW